MEDTLNEGLPYITHFVVLHPISYEDEKVVSYEDEKIASNSYHEKFLSRVCMRQEKFVSCRYY